MSNKIICKKIASMLSLYIDNKVSLQESSFIEEHLSNCKECQKKYLYLKSLIKDLKASYKQVLELTMKKQQQKLFKIREHEKFLENISPYVDNELDAKECFEFRKYLIKLDKIKPVIMCGDLNVAHEEIDLKNPKQNTKNAGFTNEERNKMTELLKSGFIDVYREIYPEETDCYTWWSYMGNARAKNIGWRIDYFLTSDRISSKIKETYIFDEIMGSDHCPVGLEIGGLE